MYCADCYLIPVVKLLRRTKKYFATENNAYLQIISLRTEHTQEQTNCRTEKGVCIKTYYIHMWLYGTVAKLLLLQQHVLG